MAGQFCLRGIRQRWWSIHGKRPMTQVTRLVGPLTRVSVANFGDRSTSERHSARGDVRISTAEAADYSRSSSEKRLMTGLCRAVVERRRVRARGKGEEGERERRGR